MKRVDGSMITLEATTKIVSAYVRNNRIPPSDLRPLLEVVHAVLVRVAGERPDAPAQPAVPVGDSVQPEHVVCLEDGLCFKSLKRHLWASHGLSPQAYRAKWGLPPTYPIVAPRYARVRSDLAKAIGLGRPAVDAAA